MSKIEWTNKTWNPITGCGDEIISPGCENCYARRMAKRLAGRYGYNKKNPFKVTVHLEQLENPTLPKKPTLFFVCSMGDLFHNDVPIDAINHIFALCYYHSNHYFLMLTKRPENMKSFVISRMNRLGTHKVIQNLGLGVTVCNQDEADEKIPLLLETPAAMRFVSIEPMLEHTNVRGCLKLPFTTGVDWVICGPETGHRARPCKAEWVEDIQRKCIAVGVPFFLKSWGGKNCDRPLELKGVDRQVPDVLKKYFKEK